MYQIKSPNRIEKGMIMGDWEVVNPMYSPHGFEAFIECVCTRCGQENILTSWVLRRENPSRCRKCQKKYARRANSIAGSIVGRWKVLSLGYPKKEGIDYSKRWYLTHCILCGYQRHQRPDQLQKNLDCIECRHTF